MTNVVESQLILLQASRPRVFFTKWRSSHSRPCRISMTQRNRQMSSFLSWFALESYMLYPHHVLLSPNGHYSRPWRKGNDKCRRISAGLLRTCMLYPDHELFPPKGHYSRPWSKGNYKCRRISADLLRTSCCVQTTSSFHQRAIIVGQDAMEMTNVVVSQLILLQAYRPRALSTSRSWRRGKGKCRRLSSGLKGTLQHLHILISCYSQCCGAGVGRSQRFLAGAGADLKFELEPEPIFWVGSGSFFWQVKNEMISRYSLFIVW